MRASLLLYCKREPLAVVILPILGNMSGGLTPFMTEPFNCLSEENNTSFCIAYKAHHIAEKKKQTLFIANCDFDIKIGNKN